MRGLIMTGLEQSLILLLTTAALSGFLVPFILNRVQIQNQQRQKQFDADLARQTKVIEEQAALIERFSTALWEFQLALIAPLYYGQWPSLKVQTAEIGAYEEAAKKYLSDAGSLLGSIRAEIGKAVRLVPHELWLNLRNLYYEELLRLDQSVTDLISTGLTDENSSEWRRTNTYAVTRLAEIIDTTIDEIAEKLQLKYKQEDIGSEAATNAKAASTLSRASTQPQGPDR
jgi:hypothetical protein